MAEISADELSERLDSDDRPYVLDIRPEAEFEDWHIPGSENIPAYDTLQDDPAAADDALATAPEDEEIVTVCAAGVLSQTATERLTAMGYDAKTLVDGMEGWSRVHRDAPLAVDIEGTLVQVTRPGKGCLSHVLVSDGEAAVFDPSQYVEEYESILDERDADLVGRIRIFMRTFNTSMCIKLGRNVRPDRLPARPSVRRCRPGRTPRVGNQR